MIAAVTFLLIAASLTGSAYSQCYSLTGGTFYTCVGNNIVLCTSATQMLQPIAPILCNSGMGDTTYGGSASKPVCFPGQTDPKSVCQAAPPACTSAGFNPVFLGTGTALTCNSYINCAATNAAGTTFVPTSAMQSCPAGQNFNPTKGSCETGYVCTEIKTTSTTITSSTTPATTCSPLTKEIDPTTCRGYRFCTIFRTWKQVPCLLGLRYDPVMRMCKFASLVQCNGRPE